MILIMMDSGVNFERMFEEVRGSSTVPAFDKRTLQTIAALHEEAILLFVNALTG